MPSPPVEIGLDVSATPFSGPGKLHRGPRLIVNFNGRDSLQVTASLQKLSVRDPFEESETDLYLAAYRRLVHVAGPMRVSATIGGGVERIVIVTPAITFGNPPVTVPSTRGIEVAPAFTTGAAIDLRLRRRAAIVLESSFVLTNRLGGRFSAGVVLPVGAYPSDRRALPASVPWARLDPGRRAWVTTIDGSEVDGEVVDRSAAALTLRTRSGTVSLGPGEVRAIDTTDRIRNGTVLGAKIGGLGAIAPSVLITFLVCALDDRGCSAGDVLWINGLFIGMGTGIGAATGALADSLRERRVTVYRSAGPAGVSVAPIVGGHRLGGRAVIRW
jgi:hypothetical protein